MADDGWGARVLAETIAWCASRGHVTDPSGSLRTPELRPALLTATQYVGRADELVPPTSQQIQAAIARIAHARSSLLHSAGAYPGEIPPIGEGAAVLCGGRLLVCQSWQMSLIDGDAEYVSQGFFDGDDLPPWDTWLWYDLAGGDTNAEYLLAWIPPLFLDLARKGTDHNIFGCFEWAEEDVLPRLLRADGIPRDAG